MSDMNKLDAAKRVQILSALIRGMPTRSISRLADVSFNTVAKLHKDAGVFCAGSKQKNVANMKKPVDGAGDAWTWTAIDADSRG